MADNLTFSSSPSLRVDVYYSAFDAQHVFAPPKTTSTLKSQAAFLSHISLVYKDVVLITHRVGKLHGLLGQTKLWQDKCKR